MQESPPPTCSLSTRSKHLPMSATSVSMSTGVGATRTPACHLRILGCSNRSLASLQRKCTYLCAGGTSFIPGSYATLSVIVYLLTV
jgi:hypothetical protein